ncbi:MAG: hypothetical protein ABIP79_11240 [Chitinophagaceae bacterium]
MRQYIVILLLACSAAAQAQINNEPVQLPSVAPLSIGHLSLAVIGQKDIQLPPQRWKLSKNHVITGALIFTAGMAKGFNETLQFHWKSFRHKNPGANPKWFNPAVSWRNKYENNDPNAGAKFPLSTSLLVMFTDQYHLNNFVNRLAWGSALVVKIGEKKKPLKQYLLDMLYYTACHQVGFGLTYYPFTKYKGN